MNNRNNPIARIVLFALCTIGVWNLGIIVFRTFIFHQPYSFDLLMHFFIPMILGIIFGFAVKPKQ